MSDVAERVKKIVIQHLGVDAEKVVENADFIDDLGADSLDRVELVMAFEEEFGVEIPDDAAESIVTVGDAVRFVEKAKAAVQQDLQKKQSHDQVWTQFYNDYPEVCINCGLILGQSFNSLFVLVVV
jgi:acyl carrier protein